MSATAHRVTAPLGVDDLTSLAVPSQPALSPDGSRIAYMLRTVDAEQDRDIRALWMVGAEAGEPAPLTTGPADVAPAWSPDATRLAFLRAEDGPAQIWLVPAAGGEPERLTSLPLGAGEPRWSPDASRIAFSSPAGTEVDPVAPLVFDRLDYQADGRGMSTRRRRLHVVDVVTGECRRLTSGDWHATEPAWSPDGTRLAFIAATAADADLTARTEVYLVDAGGGAPAPVPFEGFAHSVAWTPDGAGLLVVASLGDPLGQASLIRVALDGGSVDLAPSLDRSVMPGRPAYPGARPQVAAGGTVLFCMRDNGYTHVYGVPVDGGTPRGIVTGDGRHVSALSIAGDRAAILLGTPTSLGEVVTVDLRSGGERIRTDHGALARVRAREERIFTISDGTAVHGWLLYDPAAATPQPLLLDIHGGPHNAWNGAADEVHLYHHELVNRGWVVLILNPRASDGYGRRFFDAARRAWGEADAKDLLEPIDELVADGRADARRLAVTGYSYGGYMTCYLTAHDARFAAAVAGGVVSDLVSMAGTSDLGHIMSDHEHGGQPWEAGVRYQAMSPLAHVAGVRTPTLILHGGADLRCPVGQAQQWHTALRRRGVPTRLVLYPGASHLFLLPDAAPLSTEDGRPSHRLDYNRRVVDWVVEHAEQLSTGEGESDEHHRRQDVG